VAETGFCRQKPNPAWYTPKKTYQRPLNRTLITTTEEKQQIRLCFWVSRYLSAGLAKKKLWTYFVC